MAKIAYILLCHKDPDAVASQARRLTAAGDCMVIHFDASARPEDHARLHAALDDHPDVAFARRRVRCGWGEWSLVDATLTSIRTALECFPDATHFYLLSGDCMPIKTAEYIHRRLDEDDADFIESFDFFDSDWIKTGWKEERLIYRHWFNERTQKNAFYAMFHLQKWLRLTRAVPDDIEVMIGSQWWCLRRATVEKVLDYIVRRRDVVRFFRTTWIPDETFFQTLVRHLVPGKEIRSRTLTFLMFTDYGKPVIFYNDHYDLLLSQDYLFARKISPEARSLKYRLGRLYATTGHEFRITNEGAELFGFLTSRGRVGRRFARRVWETESSLGRNRELMILVCKKWHVAKRIIDRIRQITNVPAIEYLFNEENTPLPDLGGLEKSLGKRARHRRALMRMLFDYFDSDRMIICLDPVEIDLLHDFASDRSLTRILEIQCGLSDEYLKGHAVRMGLAGEQTPPEAIARLLPAIRGDIENESDRIRDAGFQYHYLIRDTAGAEENARSVAAVLSVDLPKAREVVEGDHLFSD